MFLVMITGFVPISQNVPYMGWFFLTYVVLVSLMTLSAIILEKIYHRFVIQSKSDDDFIEEDDDKPRASITKYDENNPKVKTS